MVNVMWNPVDGIRYINEQTFVTALRLAQSNHVWLEMAENNQGINVFFENDCMRVANESGGMNMCIMRHLETQPITRKSWLFIGMNELQTSLANLSKDPYEGCSNCIYGGTCVFYYAGYIRYLMDANRSQDINEQRQFYSIHKEEIENNTQNPFAFTKPISRQMDLSDEFIEVADMLQTRGYVALRRNLVEADNGENCYCFDTVLPHPDVMKYPNLKKIKEDIQNNRLNYEKTYKTTTYVGQGISNSTYPAYLLDELAASIDYMKQTGKYTAFMKERAERKNQVNGVLEQMSVEIPEVKKILSLTESEAESSMYFVIEGERGVGKRQLIENIATYLTQTGKIHSSDYNILTFDKAGSCFAIPARCDTDWGLQSDEYMIYHRFADHKLYVINDLKEFLYGCKEAVDGDGSKYSQMIKLLGRYQSDTYIIVLGEKKYVDAFLRLSPSIAFNFGRNIIHMPNLSPEKLYESYQKKLSPNLQEALKTNGSFWETFRAYVEKNRRAMPIENQELVAYLANYSNINNALELPPYAIQNKTAEEMLQSVIGMENVKKMVKDFAEYAKFVKAARDQGVAIPNSNMHMIFTGNPGTGKTMIARIIAQILFELGIVEENHLVEVQRKDLVAGYVGQTAPKTQAIIDQAMNGVLFIDEAYTLAGGGNDFGGEAIATLIKAMEDHKDKIVVIFAGYSKEMHDFLNINPGIASRIGYNIHFDDYSPEELLQMYDVKMKDSGFEYENEEEVHRKAKELCEHFSGKRNFGNGRFIDKVIQKTLIKKAGEQSEGPDVKKISENAVPSIEELVSNDVVEEYDYERELDKIIGLDDVKSSVTRMERYVKFQQLARKQGAKIPMTSNHMLFVGNPGTGKTTIARVMMEMLYSIGVIREHKLIEVERKDLVAGYIGQTAQKTGDVIERAMNGVLFIDEAYTLTPTSSNDYGSEAIATLIKAMEDHRDELVVIFAGYKDEMKEFVDANPGIASRIGFTFDFADYSADELTQMFCMKLERNGFFVEDAAKEKAREVMKHFARFKNFGNGRFVDRLIQNTLIGHSQRDFTQDVLHIAVEDIPTIEEIQRITQSDDEPNRGTIGFTS